MKVFIIYHMGKKNYILDDVYKMEFYAMKKLKKLQRKNGLNEYYIKRIEINL